MRLRPALASAVLFALLLPTGLSAQPRRARRATRPSRAELARAAESIARPWTLVRVQHEGREALAMARRDSGAWQLAGVLQEEAQIDVCDSPPCPWPASLGAESALVEPPALPERVVSAVAYARALMEFEGPLNITTETADPEFEQRLPEQAWSITSPRRAPNLVPFLEQLRRHHPVGACSMDRRPQRIAFLRTIAAAQAGRTGWTVQGWVGAVAYFRSSRVAWSSYGQSHPERHLELLEMVNVDPARLMLGLSIDLPGQPAEIGLADARRIAPDLGPGFAADLRRLAGDASIDPFNRARLLAIVADLPFESDPLWASLPPESRALLAYWSR